MADVEKAIDWEAHARRFYTVMRTIRCDCAYRHDKHAKVLIFMCARCRSVKLFEADIVPASSAPKPESPGGLLTDEPAESTMPGTICDD